ncbi:diguanylate cyclase [Desulfovibrio sp. X2]|uniref:sensor domain-containing diguanylate cyclase n=1 Tax=Desulfovibrio sp. X2 TaxID=941449 RepID=UPI000358F4B4|nr:GGDEF domain-containing protein [Desulfovibrio sp. X2]EPR37556.1 diguanylate cyclase [Desulfovibrio sp. X2]
MQRGEQPELMWGLGLTGQEEKIIRAAAGKGFPLRVWNETEIPGGNPGERQEPFLIWIPQRVWQAMRPETREFYEGWEEPQRVLILEEDADEMEFEHLVKRGFLTAVRAPLSKTGVQEVLHRANEIRSLYADIFRMTREIFLERELLARKTDQLLFLNQILTRATESLDAGTILANAREDMNTLFPVSAVQAALWTTTEGDAVGAHLLLCPLSKGGNREAWVEYFLENAAKLAATPVKDFQVELLPGYPEDGELSAPEAGRTILLPLRSGFEYFGCLALTAAEKPNLAKDQIQTVRAAVNHLALALRNAMIYSQVKTRAEYDGLTRIHNRSSFDERLLEELKRHQRYRHPLSLLLLDLDHFKSINDDHGHKAGDAVLRTIGRILSQNLRATDFSARYGGEEFVVLLPQTNEDEAWLLADRLRAEIARQSFTFQGKTFGVTTSIGVASMKPGALAKVRDLVQEADTALYMAKSAGRNMVCLSEHCDGTHVRQ